MNPNSISLRYVNLYTSRESEDEVRIGQRTDLNLTGGFARQSPIYITTATTSPTPHLRIMILEWQQMRRIRVCVEAPRDIERITWHMAQLG